MSSIEAYLGFLDIARSTLDDDVLLPGAVRCILVHLAVRAAVEADVPDGLAAAAHDEADLGRAV